MTQREIDAAIYVTGGTDGWKVQHAVPGQAIVCYCPSRSIALVVRNALRTHAKRAVQRRQTKRSGR